MRRISLLPLLCYGAMFAYACYAAIVVGHWPYYANPDPKLLPPRVLLYVASVVMLIGALSVLLIPLGYGVWRTVARLRHIPVPKHGSWILWYGAGVAVWAVDFAALHRRLPWHSILSWMLD